MKLWQKNYDLDKAIEQFTVGRDREFDLELAPYDILGSLAHIRMLESIDLLSEEELQQLSEALKELFDQAVSGDFEIAPGVEDVHSQVEMLLTRRLGDMGKKIHAGRSRNDQVLVDLRLFFRAEIREIAQGGRQLFDLLTELSEQHKDILMPGYTHLQIAMPSSFGLWFGAWAENLVDDLRQLETVYRIVNQNPLGSAAGYGSSFPLNRRMTTELLGFDDLAYNVVHAQLGRGKTELFFSFALSAFGATLGRLAMDIVLFMNQNFGFVSFPDALTTGSSIMPHKKNPDVFELTRAKANQLQALPQQVSLLCANLPSGYHRDFQLLKEALFPAIHTLKACLEILTYALSQIKVNPDILEDEKYRYLFSVEEVNKEVRSGTPFRDAYRRIGEHIASGTFHPEKKVHHTHEGSIGNLSIREIRGKFQQVWESFKFEKAIEKERQLLK
jgi:argininosuccinate lyase